MVTVNMTAGDKRIGTEFIPRKAFFLFRFMSFQRRMVPNQAGRS